MAGNDSLTIKEVRALFESEIAGAGARVSDTYDDGTRLFARSILPGVREVRPKDPVQGGVALRATDEGVWVHPYVFRQVCTNGAIMAQAIQTRHIATAEIGDKEFATRKIREAIRACCSPDAFATATEQMRSAAERKVDMALTLLPMLARMSEHNRAEDFRHILQRFLGDADRSMFGLMNAVTSVARDTPDPEDRWRLEELGGGIPAARLPEPVFDDAGAREALPREEISVEAFGECSLAGFAGR